MITYTYETIPPAASDDEARQFEHLQHIGDEALSHDPVTGYPVKRVISGGLGFSPSRGAGGGDACCGGGCGCGH